MEPMWSAYVRHMINNIQDGQRNGQACFNALHSVKPDDANSVRGTEIDPFYDDALLADFSEYVMSLDWSVS